MSRKKRFHRANSQDDIGGESACGETRDTRKGRRQRDSKASGPKENKCRCSTRRHGSEHKAHHAGTSRREIFPRAYNALVKRWDPIFSTNRPPKFSESWVVCKRRLLGEGCGIDLFLKNTGYSSPLYYFDEVKELCYGVKLNDLKAGKGEAGNKRVAWLDSRSCLDLMEKHDARDYQSPLTATSLYYNLSRDLLSMRRILIYIPCLDQNFILALAETSPFHQVEALKDAIYSYIQFQSSFRYRRNESTRFYATFQLDLHITFFKIRDWPRQSNVTFHEGYPDKKLLEQGIDLSFLELPTPYSEQERHFALCKSQFSLVLCGSDNQHWVGYAFGDRGLEDDTLEMEESEEEDLEDDGSIPGASFYEDPIASGEERVIDANKPISDPRAYFLIVFDIRIARVLKNWEILLQTMQRAIYSHRNYRLASVSRTSQSKDGNHASNEEEAFDWIQRLREVTIQLRDTLSETVKSLEAFCAHRGDIGYFRNVGSSLKIQFEASRALSNIIQTLETLKGVEQKLVLLDQRCQKLEENLHLRVTVQSNRAAHDTLFTTEWTISIFSPIALAIAYCSMQPAFIAFTPSRGTFVVALLVFMVGVRLFFDVLSGQIRHRWWWTTVARSIKLLPMYKESAHPRSFYEGLLASTVRRRRCHQTDLTLQGIEMGPMTV